MKVFDFKKHPLDHRDDRRIPDAQDPGAEKSAEEVRAQWLDHVAARIGDEFRKAMLLHEPNEVVEFVFDFGNLTGTSGFGVGTGANIYTARMPGHLLTKGVYFENGAANTVTAGIFIDGQDFSGAPFFTVKGGNFKGLPVNERKRIQVVTVAAIAGGAPAAGSISRLLLFSYYLNPRQGTLA